MDIKVCDWTQENQITLASYKPAEYDIFMIYNQTYNRAKLLARMRKGRVTTYQKLLQKSSYGKTVNQ
jgi:hypothetical protein